jgi:galactonate dehydratase
MQITKLQTVQFEPESDLTHTERDIDLTLLRVHTDEGVIGLGETFPQARMEAGAIHDPIAEQVLGRDPRNITAIQDGLLSYFNYYGHAGAEMRAMSALDIALWDLKGKLADKLIYQLLGEKTRKTIPVYNTCYDERYDFIDEPVALAESLLEEGITAMKIWPFDEFAGETGGQRITTNHLKASLDPVRCIRAELGDRMDIAVELHG